MGRVKDSVQGLVPRFVSALAVDAPVVTQVHKRVCLHHMRRRRAMHSTTTKAQVD